MLNSPEKFVIWETRDRAGAECNIKVILVVIGMQLFHIRNQLFYIVKCISDLRGNKPFLLCKRTIVEVEEETECDVLEELMKGQNNLGPEGNEWLQKWEVQWGGRETRQLKVLQLENEVWKKPEKWLKLIWISVLQLHLSLCSHLLNAFRRDKYIFLVMKVSFLTF